MNRIKNERQHEEEKKKIYKDFIGAKLQYTIDPYQYSSPREALEDYLACKIKEELDDYNGLNCDFKKIQTKISAGMIIVSGTVTECSMD